MIDLSIYCRNELTRVNFLLKIVGQR